jgi:hypothetical protein
MRVYYRTVPTAGTHVADSIFAERILSGLSVVSDVCLAPEYIRLKQKGLRAIPSESPDCPGNLLRVVTRAIILHPKEKEYTCNDKSNVTVL